VSPKWSLPLSFLNYNIACICHLTHACYMSSHLILNLIDVILFDEECILWSSWLCCFLQPPVISLSNCCTKRITKWQFYSLLDKVLSLLLGFPWNKLDGNN
jgi:hypothetical protein